MRMAELSRRSGASIPTIKYYLREGLLDAGVPTATNQADYGERHLRRLLLVRALTELGGLSLAAARTALGLLEGGAGRPGDIRWAIDATAESARACRSESALAEVSEMFVGHGRQPPADSRAMRHAADVLTALRVLDPDWGGPRLSAYIEAACALAERDLDDYPAEPEMLLARVLLGNALFTALHRVAVTAAEIMDTVSEVRRRQSNLEEQQTC